MHDSSHSYVIMGNINNNNKKRFSSQSIIIINSGNYQSDASSFICMCAIRESASPCAL